jgi:hypothetical protein
MLPGGVRKRWPSGKGRVHLFVLAAAAKETL